MVRVRPGDSVVEIGGPKKSLSVRRSGRNKGITTIECNDPTMVKNKGPSHVHSEGAILEDIEALECSACFLALKPPIFQCNVGHVVCSVCRENLKDADKCHVCRGATGGFRRCHALERLVESIRFPCPHAAHGCAARPTFYNLDAHTRVCPHAGRRCPGKACGFVGTDMDALLQHFTGVHNWPRAEKVSVESHLSPVKLLDGFNFLVAERELVGAAAMATGSSASASGGRQQQYLFLVSVVRKAHGRSISVVHIHPQAAAAGDVPEMRCELNYSRRVVGSCSSACAPLVNYHQQRSIFRVAHTDLSNGLPSSDESFQFVLPNAVRGDDCMIAVEVGARIEM